MNAAPLLAVDGLTVDVDGDDGALRLVDGVDFTVAAGERLALVGESGSGKSVTARAVMRLDRRMRLGGSVRFDGRDLLGLDDRAMDGVRGAEIGMVFQDPMSSLDPLMTIGDQVAETLRIRGVPARQARARALAALDELRVERAAERLDAYPHEFSGGMRQRVVIAMALVAEPKLLIADEPTTALDVRVQEQVLDLLDEVSLRRGLSVVIITHDLGIVAGFADRVMVMYAGRLVEDGPVDRVFTAPAHPYTRGLIASVPRIDRTVERLYSVPGQPPLPRARPAGCAFHPRCPVAVPRCHDERPRLAAFAAGRVACHLADGEHQP